MTKYKETHPKTLREYAQKHKYFTASGCDLCALFKIGSGTVYNWMHWHPEFAEAVDEVRSARDEEVENALFKLALGYDYEETTVTSGNEGDKFTKQNKHKAPDVNAAKFWLANRRGKEWREKQEIKQTGNISITVEDSDADYQ